MLSYIHRHVSSSVLPKEAKRIRKMNRIEDPKYAFKFQVDIARDKYFELCDEMKFNKRRGGIVFSIKGNIKESRAFPMYRYDLKIIREHLEKFLSENEPKNVYIGQGFSHTVVPKFIEEGILKNPHWILSSPATHYSLTQGKLELLWLYQTFIQELFKMKAANTSFAEMGPAIMESIKLALRYHDNKRDTVVILPSLFPHIQRLIEQFCDHLNLKVILLPEYKASDLIQLSKENQICAVFYQFPNKYGHYPLLKSIANSSSELNAVNICITDPISNFIANQSWCDNFDVIMGNGQPMGNPLDMGSFQPVFFAVAEKLEHLLPGYRVERIENESKSGKPSVTFQLFKNKQPVNNDVQSGQSHFIGAIINVLWALHLGNDGIVNIAKSVNEKTYKLFHALNELGYKTLDLSEASAMEARIVAYKNGGEIPVSEIQTISYSQLGSRRKKKEYMKTELNLFDTVTIKVEKATRFIKKLQEVSYSVFWVNDDCISITLNQSTSLSNIDKLVKVMSDLIVHSVTNTNPDQIDKTYINRLLMDQKIQLFLKPSLFEKSRSVSQMIRLIKWAEQMDSNITMTQSVSPDFVNKFFHLELMRFMFHPSLNLHPFTDARKSIGSLKVVRFIADQMNTFLGEYAVTFQTYSGPMILYSALLTAKAWAQHTGKKERKIVLTTNSRATNAIEVAGLEHLIVDLTVNLQISAQKLNLLLESYHNMILAVIVQIPNEFGVFDPFWDTILKKLRSQKILVILEITSVNSMLNYHDFEQRYVDIIVGDYSNLYLKPNFFGSLSMSILLARNSIAKYMPNHFYFEKTTIIPDKGLMSSNEIDGNRVTKVTPFLTGESLSFLYMVSKSITRDRSRYEDDVKALFTSYIIAYLVNYYDILYFRTNKNFSNIAQFMIKFNEEAYPRETASQIANRLIDYGFQPPRVEVHPNYCTLLFEFNETWTVEQVQKFIKAMIKIKSELTSYSDRYQQTDLSPLKHAPHDIRRLLKDSHKLPYPVSVAYPDLYAEN